MIQGNRFFPLAMCPSLRNSVSMPRILVSNTNIFSFYIFQIPIFFKQSQHDKIVLTIYKQFVSKSLFLLKLGLIYFSFQNSQIHYFVKNYSSFFYEDLEVTGVSCTNLTRLPPI